MKQMKKIALLILICVAFMTPTAALAADNGDYLNAMVEFIQDMYYKDMSDADALKQALKGMFGGLDDYSGFYDNEETEALNSSLQGNYVGIGAALENDPLGIRIIKVYEESPAQSAGLMEGDIITAVDDVSTLKQQAEDVASRIRGDEGTKVLLTIKREKEKAFNVSITRGVVRINPVTYRIEDNLAYIKIDSFNNNTAEKFNQAMNAVEQNGIQKIILDLRSNPGGFVDQAVSVAKRIVPAGNITTLDFKSGRMGDEAYSSSLTNSSYMLAVLVDENTASASEILASAIQDAGNGILIGNNTFGKGVVQNIFTVLTPEAYGRYHEKYGVNFVTDLEWMVYMGVYPQPDEVLGTIKITTGHYLTRNGREIHGIGLKPDLETENRVNPNGVDLSLISKLDITNGLTLNAYDDKVLNAEKILRAAGYFKESPDRLMDIKTQEAVKEFQKDAKLPVTGDVDSKTSERLNSLLMDLIEQNDIPYKRALEVLGWF